MFKKGENAWINYIKNRIKSNLNFIAIAEGSTGIGKSWAMLSVAYQIDPDFSIDQVAFSFKDVMKIIDEPKFLKKPFRVVLFDECQTDINNRAWQSLTNKLFLYLTSTFRHRNIILLMASPYSDFVDSASMKLIHCKFVVKGHSRQSKLTTIRPKLQQYNSSMKKFYNHSLMVSSKRGVFKLTQWKVTIPPKHLITPYEAKKTAFTSALNEDILQQLEDIDNKKKPPVEKVEELPDKTHLLKAKWQDWFNYVKEHPNQKEGDYHKAFSVDGNGFRTFKRKCKKIGVNIEQYLGMRAKTPNSEV